MVNPSPETASVRGFGQPVIIYPRAPENKGFHGAATGVD